MSSPVRIPADVGMADKVLGPLTFRQVVILGATALLLYGGWMLTRGWLPPLAYLIPAVPLGATAVALALGQRDGVSLDRLALAALRQRLTPRRQVAAPSGVCPAPPWLTHAATTAEQTASGHAGSEPAPLRLPAEAVTDTGVIDLGRDGLAVVAACSTVNFALRTPGEQDALVAAFGRYLHSLTAPAQLLVRAERLDLSEQIHQLRAAAGSLPHPALEDAAAEHADFLADLAGRADLLRRQILLVLRQHHHPAPAGPAATGLRGRLFRPRHGDRAERLDPAARQAAETQLVRRLGEATELLAAAGVTVTPLDAADATAVLASACDPDTLLRPGAGLAAADDVITTAPDDDPDYDYDPDPGPGDDADAASSGYARERGW